MEDLLSIDNVSQHATSHIPEVAEVIQIPPPQYNASQALQPPEALQPPQAFQPTRSNRGRKAKNHHFMEKINAHFPAAVVMRQVFRKFKDAMLNDAPSDWKANL